MKQKLVVLTMAVFIITALSAAFLFAGNKEFTGYLADNLCIDNGFAADGANMKTNPENHTVMCALMEPCIDSGFALLVENGMGEFDVYKLDSKGNKMAVEFLEGLDRKDNIYVQITGSLRAGRIRVQEINDAMM
jgi:hypothetical protein